MDLPQSELMRLLQKRDDWEKGRITGEDADREISFAKQIYNHIQLQCKLAWTTSKNPKQVRRSLERRGIYGDGMLIDLPYEQNKEEKVLCEDLNKELTRQQCKERACSSAYFESCQQCDVNKSTRRLLVNRD